jgi:hypothetical protein
MLGYAQRTENLPASVYHLYQRVFSVKHISDIDGQEQKNTPAHFLRTLDDMRILR